MNIFNYSVLGKSLDFMGLYQCAQHVMEAITEITEHSEYELDMNYMLPQGAEALLKLWLPSEADVDTFMMNPYAGVMQWGNKWEMNCKFLIMKIYFFLITICEF